MSCKISSTQDYLHVEVLGSLTKEERIRMYEEVLRTSASAGQARILVEDHSPDEYRTWDYYELALKLVECGLTGTHKIAAVEHNPQTLSHLKFMETVMVNRGMRGRVFTTKDSALKWLLDA
jgi:hypothetical protein